MPRQRLRVHSYGCGCSRGTLGMQRRRAKELAGGGGWRWRKAITYCRLVHFQVYQQINTVYAGLSFIHLPLHLDSFWTKPPTSSRLIYMVVLVHLFSQVTAYVFDLFQSFSDGSSCWLNPWDAGMPWSTQFDLIPYMIFEFNFRSYFSLISKFLIFQ